MWELCPLPAPRATERAVLFLRKPCTHPPLAFQVSINPCRILLTSLWWSTVMLWYCLGVRAEWSTGQDRRVLSPSLTPVESGHLIQQFLWFPNKLLHHYSFVFLYKLFKLIYFTLGQFDHLLSLLFNLYFSAFAVALPCCSLLPCSGMAARGLRWTWKIIPIDE